jgi:hypothetical protein
MVFRVNVAKILQGNEVYLFIFNSLAPFHSLVLDCCISVHLISELEIVTRILSVCVE